MINIGWGTKIAILYSSFVIGIIGMVALAMNQQIDLTNENYYADELVYQNRIDEMNNANALDEGINHELMKTELKLTFPFVFKTKKVSGTIHFYRPSDKKKDFITPLLLNDNAEAYISLENLSKGMYKMQTSWNSNNTDYYKEEVIVIP